VAAGLFLLLAAALKAHGLATYPMAEDSFLATPRLLVATVEVEILLGFWLLSGWAPRASHLSASLFFLILAATSFYMGLNGQESCGCFGRVSVSPWWTFALDVGISSGLLYWYPIAGLRGAELSIILATGLGGIAMVGMIAGAFVLTSENPVEALARLRGESITVQPPISDVGSGIVGDRQQVQIRLRNNTDRFIRVVGGTTDCSCIATADLPISVPPHEARAIAVKVQFKGSDGFFQHNFVLWTDDEDQRVITAGIRGYVTDPPKW
jgi:hypothetical protein